MTVCSYGRRALALALTGAVVVPSHGTDYPHSIVVDAGGAFSLERGDTVTVDGPGVGRAIEVRRRASFDAYDVDIVNRSSGNQARHAYGLLAFGEASALMAGSRIAGSGTKSIGVHAQDLSRVTLQDVTLRMSGADSIGISSRSGSRVTANNVTLRVDGEDTIGALAAGPQSRIVGTGLSIVHAGKRSDTRAAYDVAGAVAVNGGASVTLARSSLATTQPGIDTVSLQGSTSTFSASDTAITAEGAGASAIALAGGSVSITGGEVRGTGHAIHARRGDTAEALVNVAGGARVVGRVGNDDQAMVFTAVDSDLRGDIVSTGSGPLTVRLDHTPWLGRGERIADLVVANGRWASTGDSSVHRLTLLGRAQVAFDGAAAPGSFRVGTFANPDSLGTVTLRTRLDAGGPIDHQLTDRLLVSGDVTGSTALHIVNAGGAGADTSPLTKEPGPGDGISVVQVGGRADGNAFHLAGGYIAVGPWQYGLVAYAPGTSDAGQRLIDGSGNDHWDYRLQSTRTDGTGKTTANSTTGSTQARARLVPQVPSYLVLAHALFGYGRESMEALRPDDAIPRRDPAWRVRTFGTNVSYRSSLPFHRYAVEYARSDRGLQVAGDLLAWSAGASTMRAGLALSTGSIHVAPRAVDGMSRAKANARGMATTWVLDTENGWHGDASYGFAHYRIDVNTPLRGDVLGRLRANANEASMGGGFRWHSADNLVLEPSGSLLWQRLRFASARDRDGLLVRPGTPRRFTLRSGLRASMQFEPRGNVLVGWSPYIDTRYIVTRGRGGSIDVSGVELATGKAGRMAEAAAGASLQFRADLTAFIDVTARARLGRGGESGMGARAGLVYVF
jgi:outer membrane autotransporter protein